jgi:branched-chain amino acid transport system ATP-binding protein
VRLELREINAGYGTSVVVRDVSLTVPDGQVVALLGPNGAGKTTLLNVASGLLSPRSGQVILDEVDHTRVGVEGRAAAGMCHVTESDSIYPGLTVGDNLRMFRTPRLGAEAVERAVSAFPRLGQRLGQPAGSLSGGEQRMLSLARAYVQHPSLVLVDEISLGLAPIVVNEIFGYLRDLVREGTGLLLVEQYVARALELADLVYVMARGQLVFVGEPSELGSGDLVARYLGDEMAATPATAAS